MERGQKTPDDLDRPKGNDLETNYLKHDIGENNVIKRFEDTPITVRPWGIDMRGDDGEVRCSQHGSADTETVEQCEDCEVRVIYDDAMDFKLYYVTESGEEALVGLLDVKTKGSPEYMGRFNKRHYDHYAEHEEEFGVPTFVTFFHVDYKNNEVYDEFVTDIGDVDVLASDESNAVDAFPDRNKAVLIPHENRIGWWNIDAMLEGAIFEETGDTAIVNTQQ